MKIYSETNPAFYYSNIELAANKHIIDCCNKSYNTFENLDLRYGSANAISCSNTHHTIFRDIDFSFIGGRFLPEFGEAQEVYLYSSFAKKTGDIWTEQTREGNGIQFLNESSNTIVEQCTFNEIYDAAISIQGNANKNTGYELHHIYLRNNIIKNSEWSFELWGRGENTNVNNIFIEHNTCINAGHGWGHTQRSSQLGSHLFIWGLSAQTDSILIRNNIFQESSEHGIYISRGDDVNKVIVDHNCWFESSGNIAKLGNTLFDFETEWESFRKTSDFGVHAVTDDPLLKSDFSLNEGTPCINAGVFSPYVPGDFVGNSRPFGSAPDIGAFEIQQILKIGNLGSNETIKIYPNPVSNHIYIQFSKELQVKKISVLNVNGKEIIAKSRVNIPYSHNKHILKTDNLINGIYFLMFETNKGKITKKIALKK